MRARPGQALICAASSPMIVGSARSRCAAGCRACAGWPLVGPVDGYLLHGCFHFSSGRDSVRMRHLAARPAVSVTHLEGEDLAVTVHGRAELFELSDPGCRELRQAILDHYLPRQGPAFEVWLDRENAIGACITAEKMFTFCLEE